MAAAGGGEGGGAVVVGVGVGEGAERVVGVEGVVGCGVWLGLVVG